MESSVFVKGGIYVLFTSVMMDEVIITVPGIEGTKNRKF